MHAAPRPLCFVGRYLCWHRPTARSAWAPVAGGTSALEALRAGRRVVRGGELSVAKNSFHPSGAKRREKELRCRK